MKCLIAFVVLLALLLLAGCCNCPKGGALMTIPAQSTVCEKK